MFSAKDGVSRPSWCQAVDWLVRRASVRLRANSRLPRAGSKNARFPLENMRAVGLHLLGVFALLVFWPAMVDAADPSLEVLLQPRRFGVEDLAQLTVRINEPTSKLGAPKIGELDNLEIVGGPSSGSEFSFVNGVASRSQTFTYVLRAVKPGPATVGRVTVVVGDAELSAEPVVAEVVEGSLTPPQRHSRRSPFSDPFADIMPRRAPPRVEVELKHTLSTDHVVVGQPVTATVYLDSTTGSIFDFNMGTAPSYPGFWAQRLDTVETPPEVVKIEGKVFYRYLVMRSVLVPLKAGRLEIPAVEAAIGVRSGSFFDSGQVVERSTPKRVVEVAERPPAPPGFAGAVGDLHYSASLDPGEIAFGAPSVLTLRLEGRGNLPLVQAPEVLPGCDGCDTYPPEEVSDVTVDADGIHGSRSWRVTVVPRQWGEIELGAVDLAVFDPAAGRYTTQTVGPLTLNVTPPPPTPTPVVTPVPAGDDGDQGGEPGSVAGRGEPTSSWLWLGGALGMGLLLGGGVTWFLTRRAKVAIPPRRAGQVPADRARVLQLTLERWWLDARSSSRGAGLEDEMTELRRDLEAVRFAPGRADHSDTVVDLEARLKRLMRRA